MREKLKAALPEKRYIHSLGVCEEAVRLAKIYGADEDKAYTAGLLHDCAKGMSTEEQLKMCDALGVELDPVSKLCPPIIHGPLGAALAEREYGICDGEILDAIRWHTIGKAGMTTLEKVIYVADITEKNRDFDGVEAVRAAAKISLDEAVLVSIEGQLSDMRRRIMHPNILEMWNDILLNYKGKET